MKKLSAILLGMGLLFSTSAGADSGEGKKYGGYSVDKLRKVMAEKLPDLKSGNLIQEAKNFYHDVQQVGWANANYDKLPQFVQDFMKERMSVQNSAQFEAWRENKLATIREKVNGLNFADLPPKIQGQLKEKGIHDSAQLHAFANEKIDALIAKRAAKMGGAVSGR
jgi:hypothetical protein